MMRDKSVIGVVLIFVLLFISMYIHISYDNEAYFKGTFIVRVFDNIDKIAFYLYLPSFIGYIYFMLKPNLKNISNKIVLLLPSITIICLVYREYIYYNQYFNAMHYFILALLVVVPLLFSYIYIMNDSIKNRIISKYILIIIMCFILLVFNQVAGILPIV